MPTAIILLAGFVLWGICLGAAKLAGGERASSATIAFIAIWFCVAAWKSYRFSS